MAHWLNVEIATRLEETARLLEVQGANAFRVEAYRRGAATVRDLGRPVSSLLRVGGLTALEQLPGIGTSLARAIRDLVKTGHMALLERLHGDSEAGASTAPASGTAATAEPPVEELLAVDREYRRKSAAGLLPRIAPRRFNPRGDAWLPVLHTERGDRHYTALFSNTARAHELDRMRDWVVLYVDGGREEGQYTVATVRRGPLKGRRVVRGREAECLRLYRQRAARRQRRLAATRVVGEDQ